MINELVSIIVPIYNVSKYIEQCLYSIKKQTYQNLEVILVNDGSTDDSPSLCIPFLDDKRFKLLNKKNGGLSDARNFGYSHSSGKYVIFIDSDDFCDKNMILSLVNNLINNNCEISICGTYKFYSDEIIFENQKREPLMILSKIDAIKGIYDFDRYGVGVWNKLFKREILEGIPFPVGKISEDYFVMYKYFNKADRICYDSTPYYYYRQRNDSITKRKSTSLDSLKAHEEFLEFANEHRELLICAQHAYSFSCIAIYDTILKNKDKVNLLKKLREKCLKYYHVSIRYEHNKKRKLQLFIFKHFRILYSTVFKLYVKKRNR